ncbi:MAG: hypothetical protein RR248_04720 [Clostridia bacterium]
MTNNIPLTNRDIASIVSATTYVPGETCSVTNFYIGDLLSFVMGKAQTNCCWLTIMSNVNVLAVAKLTECSCVLLCDSVIPDAVLLERAQTQNICILGTKLTSFDSARLIVEYINANKG